MDTPPLEKTLLPPTPFLTFEDLLKTIRKMEEEKRTLKKQLAQMEKRFKELQYRHNEMETQEKLEWCKLYPNGVVDTVMSHDKEFILVSDQMKFL